METTKDSIIPVRIEIKGHIQSQISLQALVIEIYSMCRKEEFG